MYLLGYTNDDLARIVGVSSMAVSNWITGKNMPKAKHIKKMVQFAGIPEEVALNPSKEVEI